MSEVTPSEAEVFIRSLNLMTLRLMGAAAYFEELRNLDQAPPTKVLDLYRSAKLALVRFLSQIEPEGRLEHPLFEMPAAVWSPRASQRVVRTISNADYVARLKEANPDYFQGNESLGDAESLVIGGGALLAAVAIVALAPVGAVTAPVVIAVSLGAAVAATAALVTRSMVEDSKAAQRDSDVFAQVLADCRAGKCPPNAAQIIDVLAQRSDERAKRAVSSPWKALVDALTSSTVPLVIGGGILIAITYRAQIKALLPAPKSTTAPALAGRIGGSF